ncbi:unnamed protein product [Prorocentrum cordatum]|uniref:Uncharacterized protein n=1 Tax=Prorocentrum cordatum TaxID=2364126 RepID=A0ABN9YAK4_9DINO|nr:unnamed protein product [Polarella glacialis]
MTPACSLACPVLSEMYECSSNASKGTSCSGGFRRVSFSSEVHLYRYEQVSGEQATAEPQVAAEDAGPADAVLVRLASEQQSFRGSRRASPWGECWPGLPSAHALAPQDPDKHGDDSTFKNAFQESVERRRIKRSATPNVGAVDEVTSLQLLVATTTDEPLRVMLQKRTSHLQSTPSAVSGANSGMAIESVRKAVGAWKDADHEHTQCANNVLKLRTALQHAEEKDITAAEVTWGDAVFEHAEELELKQGERETLRKLRAELIGFRDQLAAKSEEVKAKLSETAALKEDVENRLAKKRKGEGGVAAPGGGDSAAETASAAAAVEEKTGAPAASEEESVKNKLIAESAARISAAKFEAQRAAFGKGKGGDAAPAGKGPGGPPGRDPAPQVAAAAAAAPGPEPDSESSA